MSDDVFVNRQFDQKSFELEILLTLTEIKNPKALFDWLVAIKRSVGPRDAEANLDLTFAYRLLEALEWPLLYQRDFKFYTLKKLPDFFLFAICDDRDEFLKASKEAKLWQKKLPQSGKPRQRTSLRKMTKQTSQPNISS